MVVNIGAYKKCHILNFQPAGKQQHHKEIPLRELHQQHGCLSERSSQKYLEELDGCKPPEGKGFEANPADIFVIWCQHNFPEWLEKRGSVKRVSWEYMCMWGKGAKKRQN